VDAFIYQWATVEEVFAPKALGTFDNDDFVDSDNPEYVMGEIRRKYLLDSSVTILLVGKCTHSRRFVDWELKASLRQGANTPNGLVAFVLPLLCPQPMRSMERFPGTSVRGRQSPTGSRQTGTITNPTIATPDIM
jgi:hypothetical protein